MRIIAHGNGQKNLFKLILFIMKATIFFFACQDFEKQTGYKHKQEVEIGEIFNIMAFIFGTGLNVMLYHASPTDVIIIVDNKRFTQR